jgi:hypothetical protein
MRYPRILIIVAALALLAVPGFAQSTCGATISVVNGDTLTAIASRCNTTVEELIRLNPGVETGINVGQLLTLPNYAPAAAPPIVSVTPLSGAPGTALTIAVNGMPAYTEVRLRLGAVDVGTVAIQNVVTTANGAVRATMTIPDSATVGQTYILIAETLDGRTNGRSFPIDVDSSRSFLFDETRVFLVALGDAGVNGTGVGCRDSIVPTTVPIAPTIAPLRAALNTLLASSARTYPGTTYYNALNASDLDVASVAVVNGEAQIDLTGTLVVGGACDVPRIRAQLEQTALQYNTVSSVAITVNGSPLDELLGLTPPEPAPTPIGG